MTPSDGSNRRAELRGPARPPPRWGRTGRMVAVAAGLLVVVFGVRWATSGDSEAGGPVFRTAPVERREIVTTVEATGMLGPRDAVLVLAPVEGRLAEIAVEARQRVDKGDLLARLDARSLAFEVRRAEAGVAAAQGALAQAKAAAVEADQQRDRARRLAQRGQLSEADLQSALAAAESAEAAVRVATAKLKEAQASRKAATFAAEQTDIVAPRDGVVLKVPSELGLAVSPKGPVLFTVSAPLAVLRLEASVGEADIGDLEVGQPAEFDVQAYPERKFEAKVESIGVVADRRNGVATYRVHLTAPNADRRLLPGMSANVRFEVARVAGVLAVRDAALRFRPGDAPEAPPRSRVFKVAADGRVSAVSVETGVSDGIWTEVKLADPTDLSVGDALAVGYLTGSERATPGLKIGG